MRRAGRYHQLITLFVELNGARAAVDPDKPFTDFGLSAGAIASYLRAVESTFGVTFEERERRAAVSIHAVGALLDQKQASALLRRSLRLPSLLDWSARRTPSPPVFRFTSSQGPDLVVPQADFLAMSAELARRHLAPRALRTRAGRLTVVIAVSSPFLGCLAFVGALRCGARPVILPARVPPARAARCVTVQNATTRVNGGGVLLVVDDRAGHRAAAAARADAVVVPSDPEAYLTCPDPYWVHDDAAADDVAWMVPDAGTVSSGGVTGTPMTHEQSLDLVDDLSRTFWFNWAETVVTWLPLEHELGVPAALLWPVLMGRSATVMAPEHFLDDPARWLHELGHAEASITLAPPQALAHAVLRVSDEDLEMLDLSGVNVLATGGAGDDDWRLAAFERRFRAAGFSPQAYRQERRLAEWPFPDAIPPGRLRPPGAR